MQEHVWPPNKANKENLCPRIQKELATNIVLQVTFSGTSALTSVFHFLVVNTEKLKITANLTFQEILSSLTQVKIALTLVTARINGVLKGQKQRSRYREHTHTHTRARAFFSIIEEQLNSDNSGYGNSDLVLGDGRDNAIFGTNLYNLYEISSFREQVANIKG